MAASFRDLLRVLREFEEAQFARMAALSLPVALQGVAHGGVQSVSIEPALATRRSILRSYSDEFIQTDDNEFPVVVAVGINYCQQKSAPTFPQPKRWLRDPESGWPTVIDYFPEMRQAADTAMAAYQRNRDAWTSPHNGRVSHAHGCPVLSDYLLVATNFCPLITARRWADHRSVERKALLSAATVDLKQLISLIGSHVDLWIGHGREHWARFDALRHETGTMKSWMVTYNLSGLGSANMVKRQKKGHLLYG